MTEVHIVPGGEGSAGYTATIDGLTLPIAAYTAEPGDSGQVVVALLVAADALQVGIPPARKQPERRNEPPLSTWGNPNIPDPRANIPGWQPPAVSGKPEVSA